MGTRRFDGRALTLRWPFTSRLACVFYAQCLLAVHAMHRTTSLVLIAYSLDKSEVKMPGNVWPGAICP